LIEVLSGANEVPLLATECAAYWHYVPTVLDPTPLCAADISRIPVTKMQQRSAHRDCCRDSRSAGKPLDIDYSVSQCGSSADSARNWDGLYGRLRRCWSACSARNYRGVDTRPLDGNALSGDVLSQNE
jgi:hypothetical protein